MFFSKVFITVLTCWCQELTVAKKSNTKYSSYILVVPDLGDEAGYGDAT
jgi:hypothetical protein